MPFYTKRMVRFLEGKDGHHKKSKDNGSEKALRVAPTGIAAATAATAGTAPVAQTEVQTTAPAEVIVETVDQNAEVTIDEIYDEKDLLIRKGLLKASVELLHREKGSVPTKYRHYYDVDVPIYHPNNYFYQYSINIDEEPVIETPVCKIFKAKQKASPETVLAAKVYEGQHRLIADSLHMKILRVLGRNHPHIIQTWDIFHNADNNSFTIFQELANRGSLDKYLEQNPCDEAQAGRWIQQILKGLDYLGGVGITHRSLQPKHILLSHKELRVKLSGFEMSAAYWDPVKEDIKNVACLPLESKPTDKPSYQAPEVYGDPTKEEFDPLVADVWSLGATIYYMFTKQYPYDFASPDPTAVQQIRTNIANIPNDHLSDPGKRVLCEMLNPMAVERKHIDKLMSDSWIKSFK